MKRNIISLLLLAACFVHARPVFIGTASDGIYLAEFDEEAGTLTEPKRVAEYQRPSFLAMHPKLPILLCIGEPKKPFILGGSSVASFAIHEDSSLTFLGEGPTGGRGACHLAVDASGRTVAAANYSDGIISTVRLDERGVPNTECESLGLTDHGSGPNKARQEGPHPHGVYFDKANRFVFVPDLGLDKVFVYRFAADRPRLRESLPSMILPPGGGPRHMAFSPDEKHAYVINELTNTVSVAEFDAETGELKPIKEMPTLPDGFSGPNTTAEIEVHPNGNFVYGSNRGHDSIVVYRRDAETGKLTFLQHAPCGGKTPRHFKIDPSGKWLICAHQNSDTISVLALDPASGLLGAPKSTVPAPKPNCILFP